MTPLDFTWSEPMGDAPSAARRPVQRALATKTDDESMRSTAAWQRSDAWAQWQNPQPGFKLRVSLSSE